MFLITNCLDFDEFYRILHDDDYFIREDILHKKLQVILGISQKSHPKETKILLEWLQNIAMGAKQND